jgi:hypothetical protein
MNYSCEGAKSYRPCRNGRAVIVAPGNLHAELRPPTLWRDSKADLTDEVVLNEKGKTRDDSLSRRLILWSALPSKRKHPALQGIAHYRGVVFERLPVWLAKTNVFHFVTPIW